MGSGPMDDEVSRPTPSFETRFQGSFRVLMRPLSRISMAVRFSNRSKWHLTKSDAMLSRSGTIFGSLRKERPEPDHQTYKAA